MASQLQRLVYHQMLRRAALKSSRSGEGYSASFLGVAGVLGCTTASVIALTDSESISWENKKSQSIDDDNNDDDQISNDGVGKNCNRSLAVISKKKKNDSLPFSVPTPTIAMPRNWTTACEATFSPGGSLFGRASQIRRTSTIQQYKSEVEKESLRSMYKVEWKKPLGQGGFGAVYSATNRKTGGQVALKQISKKYTDNVGFQREMEAFLHLRRAGGHPNICGLHENFDEGNYFYFSLDLISGGEMFDHLIAHGAYSEEDASRLIREVASALDFCHGIGFVHGDMKPENLMLSTQNTSDAVIKLIDFGCAQVTRGPNEKPGVVGLTTAYASPELLKLPPGKRKRIDPPLDMWALGIILHIMLVGCHPFDVLGDATDTEIAQQVKAHETPPSLDEDSPMTAHLSDSAVDLIRRLLAWDPKDRITASEMLQHPWVLGETARKDKMSGSDKKLSKFRVFKSRLEAKVFEDIVSWAESADNEDVSKRTSLIERSFRMLDAEQKGFVSAKDLKKLTGSNATDMGESSGDDALSLSAFSNLLSENMKDRYFPKGKVLYKEGEIGNSMIFVNSGMLEVTTKDGYTVEVKAGNFVGEGALVSPDRTRNATVKCLTPVHAIEVSREYFDKFLAASETGLALHMREKDKKRALNRTKNILRRQHELRPMNLKKGDIVYRQGEEADAMYIVEDGLVDSFVNDQVIATTKPGEMFAVGSLITRQNRNATALCATDSCRIHTMKARDFFDLMDSSPIMKSSVTDIFMRKEFAKAVAYKTKKKFDTMSTADLKAVFDSIDTSGDGYLTLDELRSLLLSMDKNVPEDVVVGILNSLDVDASGVVDFAEFCQIFGTNETKQRA